jgi:hypothetical protein
MMSNSWSSVLALTVIVALPFAAMGADLQVDFGGIGIVKLGTPLANFPIPLQQPVRKTADCRAHRMDARLMVKPGSDRGV